jgi:hypothetical protein
MDAGLSIRLHARPSLHLVHQQVQVYFYLLHADQISRLDQDQYTLQLVILDLFNIKYFIVVDIPHINNTYHSLALLADPNSALSSSSLGWPSTIYQAMTNDGTMVCLRRLAGFSLAADEAIHNIEAWTRIKSSGIFRFNQ